MPPNEITRRSAIKYVGGAAATGTLAGCTGGGGDGGSEGDGGSTGDGGGTGETITLVWTDHFPPGDFLPLDITSRLFMEKVEERTGGRVQFDYHPGGDLGGSDETMSLVQSGSADIGHIVPSYYSDVVPYTVVGDLPAMGEDILPPSKAIHDMLMPHRDGLLFRLDWEEKGVRPLLTSISPQYMVASAVGAIETMEDLEGLNVRTGGGPAAAQAESLGASPVNMGATEIYQAFERGTIDADMNALEIWDAFKIYEVFTHMTRNAPLVRNTLFEGMNMDSWNSLPGDVQEIFIDQSNKNAKNWADGFRGYIDSATTRFEEEYDVQVYSLPDEERSRWTDALTTGVVDPWVSNRPDPGSGEDVLGAYRDGIEEYQ